MNGDDDNILGVGEVGAVNSIGGGVSSSSIEGAAVNLCAERSQEDQR